MRIDGQEARARPLQRSPRAWLLVGLVCLLAAPAAGGAGFSAFGRLVIVTAGPDAGANGQALRDALAFAVAALPSATAPWTLRLSPGVYDVGASRLSMVAFVDIEGSGEGTTKITAQTDGAVEKAAVYGADDAELRHLTVENTGFGAVSRAIRNVTVSTRLTHVTAVASGGAENNQGITNGGGTLTVMRAVTAVASGGEIAEAVVNATGASPVMIQVVARASGGSVSNWAMISVSDASVTIRESVLEASGTAANAIINFDTATANVANSQLIGGVSGSGFVCVGAYDGSFAALGTDCS